MTQKASFLVFTGGPESPQDISLVEDWSKWLLVERGASQATLRAYSGELRRLASLNRRPLRSLEVKHLRAYLYGAGGKPSTVARRIAAMRSFYGWLVRVGRRLDDPSRQLDSPRRRRAVPHPVADFDALAARLDPEFRAIAVFLVSTGLRLSEACAVDVGLPVPTELWVSGKSGERIVPLTEVAAAALTELGGRIRPKARVIQRRFADAGFHAHALRHTFATRLAEAEVDLSVIQDLLGHASPATTRVYQQNSPARLRRGMVKAAR
ncbi:MAG: tyrosine-type recombinase/integrase [bacterium]